MRYLRYFLPVLILLIFPSCAPWQRLHWYKPKPLGPLPEISLTGKKILIDPGHGGSSSGAIGKNGTKEKVVNLAVARILKVLLEQQGASVYMTREEDVPDSLTVKLNIREDLASRCLFRDSIMPDLFVSIHHNGSEDGSRKVNIPKIFYAGETPELLLMLHSVSIPNSQTCWDLARVFF